MSLLSFFVNGWSGASSPFLHPSPHAVNPVALPRTWGFQPPNVPPQGVGCGDEGAASGAASAPEWRLQRRCALSPAQFAACLGCVVALSLVLALFFGSLGAPLISAFLAAQVLIVAGAFAHHAVHAADGEWLRVEGGRLLLEGREGLRQRHESFALSSLRVAQDDDGLIELRAPGRCVRVGRHAPAGPRRQVLAELKRLVPGRSVCAGERARIEVERT